MSARQCLKRLHLEVNRPELKVISSDTEIAFEIGNRVGEVAQRDFPSGSQSAARSRFSICSRIQR